MNYSESDKFYLSYDLQLFAQEGSNGDKTEEPTAKILEDARKKGFTKIIAMIHYPPILEKDNKTKLVEILEEYNVEKVIYGHIHGQGLSRAFKGFIGSCEYILTSGDFIDFDPIKIIE